MERRGIGVLQVVGARDSLLGLRNVREIGGMPFVALFTHLMPSSQMRLKRLLDLTLVLALAPVCLPMTGLIALYVSALIRDGGTLQLGIGSLGDAVTYVLKLRHESNTIYVDLLSKAGVLDRFSGVIERLGGTGPFERGLYAATEMLVHGFLELYRCGVLKRRVHDDVAVQRQIERVQDYRRRRDQGQVEGSSVAPATSGSTRAAICISGLVVDHVW
jgi:hypothetical protein